MPGFGARVFKPAPTAPKCSVLLIAVAGHVDHGKTSLVRALTGINTDRLAEEKRRGLSIELGFAYKKINETHTLGFIDVPGHHRFMNTMISGVIGIDLGVLVVAADDGPMPQTLEHLQVLKSLGVKTYIAVISKVDLVDDDRAQFVAQEVRALYPGIRVCKVSTQSQAGIADLLDVLRDKALNYSPPETSGHFLMHIDRVFTKKGAGLVVTGTALSGTVNIGETLYLNTTSQLQPCQMSANVRGIYAQGSETDSGHAGQRCALNLAGKVSVKNVSRGDVVFAASEALPSSSLDTRFHSADSGVPQLKHMGQVKIYIGAQRISAKTNLVSRDHSKRKTDQWVQFILASPVLAFAGHRFIVRDDSENHILGSGVVIDPAAEKWTKKNHQDRLIIAQVIEGNGVEAGISNLVFHADKAISVKSIKRIWNVTDYALEHMLQANPKSFIRLPRKGDQLILSPERWSHYKIQLTECLGDWHKDNNGNATVPISTLESLLTNNIPPLLFSDVLRSCIQDGDIIQIDGNVSQAGYRPKLTLQDDANWDRLKDMMKGRLPLLSEIEKELNLSAQKIEILTRPKLKAQALYRVGDKRLALPSTLKDLGAKAAQLSSSRPFTVIDAKAAFGLGRKQTIEILEFFDAVKYTVRSGNTRTVPKQELIENIFNNSA